MVTLIKLSHYQWGNTNLLTSIVTNPVLKKMAVDKESVINISNNGKC